MKLLKRVKNSHRYMRRRLLGESVLCIVFDYTTRQLVGSEIGISRKPWRYLPVGRWKYSM